jgi:hypothetical protein
MTTSGVPANFLQGLNFATYLPSLEHQNIEIREKHHKLALLWLGKYTNTQPARICAEEPCTEDHVLAPRFAVRRNLP